MWQLKRLNIATYRYVACTRATEGSVSLGMADAVVKSTGSEGKTLADCHLPRYLTKPRKIRNQPLP